MKIDPKKKIEVYFNLHKKTWSVRQSGKVVLHTNYIQVKDPQYVVRQGGNERVRREKKKNVHAFVRGYITEELPLMPRRLQFVSYNPYKNNSFVVSYFKTIKRHVSFFSPFKIFNFFNFKL